MSSLAGCYRVQVFRVFAGVERKTGRPQSTRRSQGMTGLPLLPSRASVDISPPHLHPWASVVRHFTLLCGFWYRSNLTRNHVREREALPLV